MLSVRDVAAGRSSGENRTRPTHSATPSSRNLGAMSPRTPLGSLGINTPPHPADHQLAERRRRNSESQRKTRLVKAVKESIDSSARNHAASFGMSFEQAQEEAYKGVMSHEICQQVVDDKCKAKEHEHHAVVQAVRDVWSIVSRSGVVASEGGYLVRRTMLGIIGSPRVGFAAAKSFLGGTLKEKTYKEARGRREEALKHNDFSKLAGKRKQRSDNLEDLYPLAMARIRESIDERTQPSPCATKTKHDRAKGNHYRSDADNSLVCKRPELCQTHGLSYMMGTQLQLYNSCMEDLQAAFDQGHVEVGSISKKAFEDIIPFYVVEQSPRSCLCVHCYKAKLATVSLVKMWPTLHHGETTGAPCSCTCDLCSYAGGCKDFLPYSSPKEVSSMGKLSDKLMCDKIFLYTAAGNGQAISAHSSVCVSGNCPRCKEKQDRFFGCPRNRGGTDRDLGPASTSSSSIHPAGRPSGGTVEWSMFDTVDEAGRAVGPSRRRGENAGGDGESDDDSGGAGRPRQKKGVVVKRGTVDEFFGEVREIQGVYRKHRRQFHHQRSTFNETLATLEEGQVVFVVDFQEQLQLSEQDEVQSQHWQHESVTIFPAPIYFKMKGRLWCYSFQFLSDDRTQDNVWVQYVMNQLLSVHVPALLRKVGAAPMTLAIIFTDNCAKQFKCRFHFGWVAQSGLMVRDSDGNVTDMRLVVEHHYFGSCHGKNYSDTEGAITKLAERTNVMNGSWVVRNPEHLCELLAKEFSFFLQEASPDEADRFYQSKSHSRGGQQLLMTKVCEHELAPTGNDRPIFPIIGHLRC
ncbi:unnamed protein product [Ectocarpus sp. 8 AP-2014]